MVTTLGAAAWGAGRLHATAQARLAKASRRTLMCVLSVLGSFEQDDPGHAPEFLSLRFGVQPSDQVPQPRERHGALEAERFLPHRSELRLLPALRLEEARTLGGRELKWSLFGHGTPPGLVQHLEQSGRREVHQPPAERCRRGEIRGEGRDLVASEVNQQTLAYHPDR